MSIFYIKVKNLSLNFINDERNRKFKEYYSKDNIKFEGGYFKMGKDEVENQKEIFLKKIIIINILNQ